MKYFTDRLEEALKKQGVFEMALANASKEMQEGENPKDDVSSAFVFAETPEGYEFWRNILLITSDNNPL